MQISNKVSSKPFNTFNIDVEIDRLITIDDVSDLAYLDLDLSKVSIIGGGSNLLLKSNIDHPVLHINMKGIEIVNDSDTYVLVEAQAGEEWHDFVLWTIENDFGGVENMSLIPGKCGAAPMQNIGAYGVEIKDVLHAVKVFDKTTRQHLTFHNSECHFGYRTSNFKTVWKDRFIITSIVLQLTKNGHHVLNTSYGAISKTLEEKHILDPSIKHISEAVIAIRQSKLPDPNVIGNSGSFFKNPVVEKSIADAILETHPNMPSYPAENGVKIPAGWLIDQCGWKGKVVGQTGTYKHQALVIVNHGHATGEEVFNLSQTIQKSVKEKFNIALEAEVNIW